MSAFNQASFPLKTLEYLAAGLPVVSTDLDASRWLATKHILIADEPEAFARHVVEVITGPTSTLEAQDRQRFAEEHSWKQRAAQMLQLAGITPPDMDINN
jgi:teichuronic acid biosynthesis glycosyltransferase TuaH